MDTRNKRSSAILVGLPFGRVFPNPDGSLADQVDRRHMALGYAQIAEVAVDIDARPLTLDDRDLSLALNNRDFGLALRERILSVTLKN